MAFDLYNMYLSLLLSPQVVPPNLVPQMPALVRAEVGNVPTPAETSINLLLPMLNNPQMMAQLPAPAGETVSAKPNLTSGKKSFLGHGKNSLEDRNCPITMPTLSDEQELVDLKRKQDYRMDLSTRKKYAKTLPGERCQICNDVASGVHFGIFCCEGCKRFFQRATVGGIKKLNCKTGTRECNVTGINRTRCKYCRFNRCIQLGMSSTMIKLGRDARKRARAMPQPNPDHDLEHLIRNLDAKDRKAIESFSVDNSALQLSVRMDSTMSEHSEESPRDESVSSSSTSHSPNSNCQEFDFQCNNDSDDTETQDPNEICEVVQISDESEDEKSSDEKTVNMVYQTYICNLYRATKKTVIGIITQFDSTTKDVLQTTSEAAVSFIGRIPGIELNAISKNDVVKAHFQTTCTQIVAKLCLNALRALRSNSSAMLRTKLIHIEQLIASCIDIIAEESQRNTQEDSEVKEAFDFLMTVLRVLEKLPSTELKLNAATLIQHSQLD